ncbi:MAG: GntP family permease [Enhydrobacter sp.]|nr:GntP family permease [Enhydrobacter sp.]
MILAALLLPVAIGALVLLIQRFGVPVFLGLMAVVAGYGIAADMTFQSIGKAFGLGFATALEQAGLLVMAGALVGALLIRQPLPGPAAAAAGALSGLGGSAAGGLALLQPAGDGAPRRAIGMALALLIVHGLVAPSPLAVASASVFNADIRTMLWIAVPVAAISAAVGWFLIAGRETARGVLSLGWLAIAIPVGLLIVQSIAQMPTEPLGKGGAREFYTGISRPLMLAVLAIALALLLSRRWQPDVLADMRWAPLLLTVAAAGGFARVLDETGMAELLAERALDARLGLLAPFLAAAIVKTMQGNSLSAVLTASGMIEPMLPALGLDSATGRALAAASVGAGSIAICHVNDPFFWIAAHMANLPPLAALRVIALGSLAVSVTALLLLSAVRLAL